MNILFERRSVTLLAMTNLTPLTEKLLLESMQAWKAKLFTPIVHDLLAVNRMNTFSGTSTFWVPILTFHTNQ
jgi:hypothetical protein